VRIARIWLALAAMLCALICNATAPASASDDDPDDCHASASLHGATEACSYSGDEAVDLAQSDDGHHYTVQQICHDSSTGNTTGGNCANPKSCPGPPPGTLYNLYRDGVKYGITCLSAPQAVIFGQITPEYVDSEWRKLDWQEAELTLQPPNGETLVNLPTVFTTSMSAEPQALTVTLLGIPVTIEATPTSWTWHSGTGGDEGSWTTNDPGTPYTSGTEPESLNSFRYLTSGTYEPFVDVTYTGRFQVNGGAWQDIPSDLTKPGTSVSLDVLPAGAHLTAY